jgi:hypothetical protein
MSNFSAVGLRWQAVLAKSRSPGVVGKERVIVLGPGVRSCSTVISPPAFNFSFYLANVFTRA